MENLTPLAALAEGKERNHQKLALRRLYFPIATFFKDLFLL